MPVRFDKINFGFASAEQESAESPHLLLKAFLDPMNIVGEATLGPRFLFLGRKGSGKSAIGLHLSLLARTQPNLFVSTYFLKDLSYQKLADVGGQDVEAELRYPRAWSWLLLLALLSSLTNDLGAKPTNERRFKGAIRALEGDGLLPANDLGDILGRSAFRQFELSIWNIQVKGSRTGGDTRPSLSTMIQVLKDLLVSTTTDSKHIVVIDGLDDVLLEDKSQNYAISGLILEASRLNQFFRQNGAPYKILVVCRTDIYERLPGANQNKIRQDMAVEVQWYEEAANPRRANLVKLANLRAKYYDPTISDMFATYFPSNDDNKNTIRFLLEHTRHTPREFLQLLRYIQLASGGADELDWYHIKAGLRSYCDSFFLPELRDELEGVIERAELDRFFECLRHLHKQQFMLQELVEFFGRSARGRDVDVERVVTALFGASALGNCHSARGRTLYTFRYRNPVAAFNPDETITTHRALARALNLHT